MMHRLIRVKPSRAHLVVAAALILATSVACSSIGSFSKSSTPTSSDQTSPATKLPVDAAPGVAAAPSGGAAAPAAAQARGAAAPAAPRVAANTSAAQPSAADSTAVVDSSAQILDRMVIRTAQLTVEVPDMESALTHARAIASSAGGFVSASNTHIERVDNQDRMVADLTLQVRSDSADSAMSDLRALGKVTSEASGSQDVTDEYVDLDSNLRNLQATEAAILKLMDKATQISDVLQLQRELTNVRGQIQRIQGRKTYLERRTDMATITLALRLPPAPSAQPLSGAWDPIATAARGWQASLTVLRGVADVLIVALAFSWWLVPFIAAAGYLVVQRRRSTGRGMAQADLL